MGRESPHQLSFPSFHTAEEMWRGIALSTYFSPIWFWQRDVGGNPSIPLICYLLILTERCGGNPPIRFIAPSDCPGKLWEEGGCPHQPLFSYLILTSIFIQQGSSTPFMPFYPVISIFPSSLSRYISFFTRKTSSVVPEKITAGQDSDNNKNNTKIIKRYLYNLQK